MDIWRLKIFCKTIELESFSKAGEVVHLTQPTISSHIKDLEDHFHCRLIDRLGKKIAPTRAGELLYRYAIQLTSLMDETESAMAMFHGKISGRLCAGGSTIPGCYILPKLIGEFTQMYPEARISLFIGDTDEILQKIQHGDIELGIVGAKGHLKNMIQEPLIEDEMRLIVKADHPWASMEALPLKMLIKEPFILREQGSGTRVSFIESLKGSGFSITDFHIVSEMGSTVAICQGIKSGAGVSVLSPIAVQEELKAGTLVALKVEGVELKRKFYLTRLKNRSLSPLGSAFIEYIRSTLISGNSMSPSK